MSHFLCYAAINALNVCGALWVQWAIRSRLLEHHQLTAPTNFGIPATDVWSPEEAVALIKADGE